MNDMEAERQNGRVRKYGMIGRELQRIQQFIERINEHPDRISIDVELGGEEPNRPPLNGAELSAIKNLLEARGANLKKEREAL